MLVLVSLSRLAIIRTHVLVDEENAEYMYLFAVSSARMVLVLINLRKQYSYLLQLHLIMTNRVAQSRKIGKRHPYCPANIPRYENVAHVVSQM